MNTQVAVSVVCNVYNHGPYLRDALEGFVTQKTTFPFEVLIHDDASTDESAEIIREYEEKYPELIFPIYQTENQYSRKVPINMTYQIPRIRGKYVAVCEGDDYWTDPEKLQKQVDFLDAHGDYTLCACSTVWLNMASGAKLNKCQTDVDRDVSLEEIINEKNGRVFQYATIVVRSELFCQRPDWMSHFGVGDTPLMIRAASSGKIRMLADVMAVYRFQAEGSWTSRFFNNPQQRIASFSRIIDGLERFNVATGGRYDSIITRRVNQLRYHIARYNQDFHAMRTGELRQVWLSRSVTGRLSDMVACKFPKLQTAIRQKLGRI